MGHEPSRPASIPQIVVEETAWGVVCPARGSVPVPAAGGLEGDLIEQANADEEAELQIYLHETEGRLARAIEEALVRLRKRTYGGVRSVRTSYFKSPVARRSLDTALPRVQGAKEHLRTVCGQAQHSHA